MFLINALYEKGHFIGQFWSADFVTKFFIEVAGAVVIRHMKFFPCFDLAKSRKFDQSQCFDFSNRDFLWKGKKCFRWNRRENSCGVNVLCLV